MNNKYEETYKAIVKLCKSLREQEAMPFLNELANLLDKYKYALKMWTREEDSGDVRCGINIMDEKDEVMYNLQYYKIDAETLRDIVSKSGYFE
jgi:hypothetical protein